jgi:tyrosine aminotransferase
LYEAVEFFLQPGKNVLIPAPCSEYIETLGFLKKVEPRYYKLLPNSDSTWRINFEDLEQRIDENTSVVLIQNPNGVCGAIHSLDELKKLKDIVERHQVPVISDEYFGDIIFGNSFHSFLEVEPNVPVVIVNSCFKRLFQKEYNIGWLALYDKDEKLNGVRSILEFTEANYFTKRILIDFDIASDLLNKHLPKALGSFCSFIQVNFGIASSIFQHCPGLKIVQQQGGWFMLILLDMTQFSSFTSDLDFCLCLFDEQSVKIPPGSLNEYPNSLKFSLLVDQHSFLQICNRLKEFCKKHANC